MNRNFQEQVILDSGADAAASSLADTMQNAFGLNFHY